MEGVRVYRARMAAALERCYAELKVEFLRRPTTRELISPASRVVYDFVRGELRIPLNRGVEDHPPLLVREAEVRRRDKVHGGNWSAASGGGHAGVDGDGDEDLEVRGRTLGTMAGEIYEAVRRGELHDRIMRFGEEAGLWAADSE